MCTGHVEPAAGRSSSAKPNVSLHSREAELELELELVQPHMAQKPMLRGGVGARALRMRSVSREEA